MPRERIMSLAARAALDIIVIAVIVQVAIGFSPVFTRFVEVVLIAAAAVPIVVVLVTAFVVWAVWATARINRLLQLRAGPKS